MGEAMKLVPDLVPESCFFKNVRSEVSRSVWDKLRRTVYAAAGNRCEVCKGKGHKHPVEAHEVWEYDEKTGVQKLLKLEALCPACHEVKHIGLAEIRGRRDAAIKHMCKVNKITKAKAESVVADAFHVWAKRSQRDWKLDVSFLDKLRT